MKRLLICFVLSFFSIASLAQVRVVTTTTNLADVVEKIGGESVSVLSLAKGTQDPHFLEAKPSYTFKLAKADLLVNIGAGLESGWLPLIIRGSRNPSIRDGQRGRLEAADIVSLKQEHKGEISRAQGDVHPEGNPHFMLSPTKALEVAKAIKDKLSLIDSKNTSRYEENFKRFENQMKSKINELKSVIKSGTHIITYHRTLTYYLDEFGIHIKNVLEPKPGIPPTASHIIKVIKEMKEEGIRTIVVENYFDSSVAKRIKTSIKDVKINIVPVAVNGNDKAKDIFSLYDELAKALKE
ncbi:metal ABC transporter substrate-binding protein [Halobacteriovorax sp.]|uniref:metal ABC transporter substrate-binding protein n=1 Tax=Halobacteriovorax sp. TaxID=2020862 RepID=UPI003AF2C648